MVPTAEAVVPGQLAGVTVLVIDVLRASTTIVTALAAGERRGEPLAGFDLGNSPLECGPERVGGRTVFFTTSNGTRALLAARGAAAVGVAALVNAGAAAAWAAAEGRDVVVLCAGERGRPSLEDDVCAGLLVERLTAAGLAPGPAALAAMVTARRASVDKIVAGHR